MAVALSQYLWRGPEPTALGHSAKSHKSLAKLDKLAWGATGPTPMALGRGWPNDLWLWKCGQAAAGPNDLLLWKCGRARPTQRFVALEMWLWTCGSALGLWRAPDAPKHNQLWPISE